MSTLADREEMWSRRKQGYFDEGEELYWLQVKDEVQPMDYESEEDRDSVGEENKSNSRKGGKDKVSFSKIPPITAFKLIQTHFNPIKGSVARTREGDFNFQIPRSEVEVILKLNQINAVRVVVEKHPFLNNTRGTVFNFSTKDMSVEEISEELRDYHVTKVIKKSFYNKKSEKKEYSGELVLTFDKIKRPEFINLAWLTHLKVEPYEPKPLMCNQCFTFGNKCFSFGEKVINECKNQVIPLCGWCLGKKHLEKGEKCNSKAKCRNCEDEHPTWYKECPVYTKEKEILRIKEEKKNII